MKRLIRRIVELAWRRLIPRQLRNSLRLWLTLDIPDRAPKLIEDFPHRRILVLAPHMDDEIIGPGGTLVLHLRTGAEVQTVILTNGAGGDPAIPRDQLISIRKTESRKAAQLIGAKEPIFLDRPDGALHEDAQTVDAAVDLISRLNPDLIYLPAITDLHPDHWATCRILRRALEKIPAAARAHLTIRGYEIWSALPANVMVQITEVVDIKKQAIALFASQTKFVDYTWTAIGLNQYRSMMHLGGKGFAEAFLESTTEEFCQWVDRVAIRGGAGR